MHVRHSIGLALVLGSTLFVLACGGGDRNSASNGIATGPTAPTGVAAASGGAAGTTATAAAAKNPSSTPGAMSLPAEGVSGSLAVTFPPRNEAYDFRANYLEQKYRTTLNRTVGSSYADIEGAIVWTQEYLRYRLGQCGHEDAVSRVFEQIDGRPAAPLCGNGTDGFPPRDHSLNFRLRLEDKYLNGLGRAPSATAVDPEGDVVWTQEYLRYRTAGCGHAETVQKIDDQINGKGVQPACYQPGQPFGPTRTIDVGEAFQMLIAYHNASGVDLGRNSTRDSRVAWFFSAVALIHYGHPVHNPQGGDRNWCVKDPGEGRPPSDDVIVRCDSRDFWDTISGVGANGYSFALHYEGRLPSNQNVYPPPLSSLPR